MATPPGSQNNSGERSANDWYAPTAAEQARHKADLDRAGNITRGFKPEDWEKALKPSGKTGPQSETNGQAPGSGSGESPFKSIALRSPFKDNNGQTTNDRQDESNNGRNGADKGDRTKVGDKGDKPVDRDYKAARQRFMAELATRLSPTELKEYERRLDNMDRRILNEHTKRMKDGKVIGEVDQPKELTERYNDMTKIAQKAENLKDEQGNQIFTHADVTEMLRGFIKSAENPIPNNDQGANNTCAQSASNKAAEQIIAGENLRTIAEMVTTGKFLATDDADGSKFLCSAHLGSMHPDREARTREVGRQNHRNLAEQMFDLRSASWAQALRGRQEAFAAGKSRDEGTNYYTYMDFQATTSQGDTGERIRDNRTGKFLRDNDGSVIMSPKENAELLSHLKQAWIGTSVADNYGKMTNIGSYDAFGRQSYMTTFQNNDELVAHLNQTHNLGWGPVTAGTLVRNYMLGPDGLTGTATGVHALAVDIAANGKDVDIFGSWGGAYEGSLSSNEFMRWMSIPDKLAYNHPDGRRGDHVFVSDRPSIYDSSKTIRNDVIKDDPLEKPGDHKPGTIHEAKKAEEEERKLAEAKKKDDQNKKQSPSFVWAQTQIAQIDAQLANLTDQHKLGSLQSQKAALENIIRQNSQI